MDDPNPKVMRAAILFLICMAFGLIALTLAKEVHGEEMETVIQAGNYAELRAIFLRVKGIRLIEPSPSGDAACMLRFGARFKSIGFSLATGDICMPLPADLHSAHFLCHEIGTELKAFDEAAQVITCKRPDEKPNA